MGIALTSALLTGCAPTVAMEPAPQATDTACANVMVRLPGAIRGMNLRETNAQSTAAWGDPAAVSLTCGLSAQAPTSLLCLPIGSVEWIIDYSNPAFTTATTHGRLPVTQVVIDSSETGGQSILADLGIAVNTLPADPNVAPCT